MKCILTHMEQDVVEPFELNWVLSTYLIDMEGDGLRMIVWYFENPY